MFPCAAAAQDSFGLESTTLVDGAQDVSVEGGSAEFYFNRNVTATWVWDNNKAQFYLRSADGEKVTLELSHENKDNGGDVVQRRTIYVAWGKLEYKTTYTMGFGDGVRMAGNDGTGGIAPARSWTFTTEADPNEEDRKKPDPDDSDADTDKTGKGDGDGQGTQGAGKASGGKSSAGAGAGSASSKSAKSGAGRKRAASAVAAGVQGSSGTSGGDKAKPVVYEVEPNREQVAAPQTAKTQGMPFPALALAACAAAAVGAGKRRVWWRLHVTRPSAVGVRPDGGKR